MRYLQDHEEIRALSTEKLVQYTEEFLKEHPSAQLQPLCNKLKEGKVAFKQPLISLLVAQHNEKKLFSVAEVKAEESIKGKYLDNITIEALRETYVNNVLAVAVEEFGEKIAVSLAMAIRKNLYSLRISDASVTGAYLDIFSKLHATNSNDDPRIGLLKLIDIYSAVYGIEILGQGIFGAVDLSSNEKVDGAKAEATQVIGDALDLFINKYQEKDNYERDLKSTLDAVWQSQTEDTLWARGMRPAAVVIREQILSHLQKALYYYRQKDHDKKDASVLAAIKLLENKDNTKYINRGNVVDPFVVQLQILAQELGKGICIALLVAVSLGSKLHNAAAQGDLEMVNKLLSENADINAKDFDGDTPLSNACRFGREEVVDVLMSHLKQNNLLDDEVINRALKVALKEGKTDSAKAILKHGVKLDPNWLLEFAREDNTKALETLLNLGVDVNNQNENGVTALHNACRHGKIKAVYLLLSRGAKVDLATKDGNSKPLDYARIGGYHKIVELLQAKELQKQQSSSSSTRHEPTALHKAIVKGDVEAVQKLVVAKADLNFKDENGYTPVMTACIKHCHKALKILIDNKADLNLRDMNGCTALMITIFLDGSVEKALVSAKLLIEGGADLTLVLPYNNDTSLDIAKKRSKDGIANLIKNKLGENLYEPAKSGDFKKIAHLIDNGANTNFQKQDGSTALHIAAFNGHLNIVDGLLSPGNANPNLARKDGFTPLHFACMKAREDVVKRLLACPSLDKTLRTNAGKTALDIAKEKGHTKIVEMLEAHARSASASTSSGFSVSIDMTAQLTRALQNSALGRCMNQR